MSIYATLWTLKFPRQGVGYPGCDWIRVRAQGVPAHIGSPTPGQGYEDGDPYGAFLPPPLETDAQGEHEFMRAVVFVTEDTTKGTEVKRFELSSWVVRASTLPVSWIVRPMT